MIRVKAQGYTLIELIVVVTLMACLLGSIQIGMRGYEEKQFSLAVREVEESIAYVRHAAVKTGRQYNIYCFTNRVLVRQGVEKPIYTIYLNDQIKIPADITGKWIRFDGSMASPKVGTVTLIHQGIKKQADITVNIATGKTTVKFMQLK